MKIQVNTDSSVKGDQRLESYVQESVENKLKRFRSEITRVEVHLRDENSEKGGPDDKRCMIEARLKGLDPTSVTHRADNVKSAVNGAISKLRKALDTTMGKRKTHR